MKFGVREICDVVFKAKANQKIGNKIFYAGEPVIYFDTLKTSSLEGAAATSYAQGGRGNPRLMSWDGDRTMTFTMEDALISPVGIMILTGAGLIEPTNNKPIIVHMTETTDVVNVVPADTANAAATAYVVVNEPLSNDSAATIYVMAMKDGEILSEPYIGRKVATDAQLPVDMQDTPPWSTAKEAGRLVVIQGVTGTYQPFDVAEDFANTACDSVIVDYYTDKRNPGTFQVDITPDKFGGCFYVEASTLFRSQEGVDMPAEFIIPNAKVQSNFTFTMAGTGDPSTFTFTLDAFPDYTRFNRTKKTLAVIQVIGDATEDTVTRESTWSQHTVNSDGIVEDTGTPSYGARHNV